MKFLKLFESFELDIIEDIKFILLDLDTKDITTLEYYKEDMFIIDIHAEKSIITETINLRLNELGYFIYRKDLSKDNTIHLLIMSYTFLKKIQKQNIITLQDIEWTQWDLGKNVKKGKINYEKNNQWVFFSILDGKKSILDNDEVEVYTNIDDDEIRFRSITQADFFIIQKQYKMFNI